MSPPPAVGGEELRKKSMGLGSKDNLASGGAVSGSRTGLAPRSQSKSMLGSRGNLSGGANQMDQATMIAQALEAGQRVYENTYKMKPERKYQSAPVRRLIEETLQKHLKDVPYTAEKIPELTRQITNELLAGVKKLNYDRYKYVVDVTICEAKGQSMRVASRCLWDITTDSCSSASFKSSSLFAVGVVFGCFFE